MNEPNCIYSITDIYEDVKNECNRSGKVLSLEIPRPIENVEVPGVGKVCFLIHIVVTVEPAAGMGGVKFHRVLPNHQQEWELCVEFHLI